MCTVCGLNWVSSLGKLKDSGMYDMFAGVTSTYDPANLLGLTCSKCGKSFCVAHLGQQLPQSLPGGKCPSCKGKLELA